ncbi:phage tail tape measure protein [Herbiconiux ginsengi]|uniref:Phage-related minor tail protein n=1 Tax=Herbiconiux ginsengi TaxID=381665 RepID=A0A1H3PN44_9MICO|nr:phage tail tape measure protein [Herbiconiux ginsengi]SDZ02446.1 Phage-related minor tail protein [Herbiconiux ginsengi]
MSAGKDFVVSILGDTGGVDKAFSLFEKNAGKIAAGAAAAFAGAKIGQAFAESLDIESSQAHMNAELNLTAAESARIGGAAGKLFAENYGENMQEVNGAVTAVIGSFDGMREASEADLASMTGKAMTFADVFSVDVGRSAQIASQMITQGIAVDGAQAFDLLTAAMNKMPVELRADLLDATDEYGGFFAQLGFSGEQAMSMLVAGSAKGMYGIDKTGDAVKEFAVLVSTDIGRTQPIIEGLGLNYGDMSAKLLAGGEQGAEATQMIVSALLGVTDPAAQAQAAVGLFGAPLEDLGTDGIPKFLASLQGTAGGLGEVEGRLDSVGDKLNDTAEHRIEEVKRGFDSWLLQIVSIPGPLGDIAAGMMAFGPAALQVAAAVVPLIAFRGAQTAGTAATNMNTAAQSANNVAWYASPVTWIIAGIVVAIGLLVLAGIWLVQNWDGVVKWLGEAWANILAGAQWFIGVISDAFLNFTPLGFIIKNWGAITEWFGGWWGGIQGMTGDAVNWLGGKVSEFVGFFTSIPDRVGEAWQGLQDLAVGTMRNIANFVIDTWNNTLGGLDVKLPDILGGAHIKFDKLQNIPALAEGGIVSSPTLALIGEAGPEAVVPLAQYRGSGERDGPIYVEQHLDVTLDGARVYKQLKTVELKRR